MALKGKSLSKKIKKPILVPQPEADYHRDYYSVFDAADGDTIKPKMIIKGWYTDADDTYTLAETFLDDVNGYHLVDLQNNPESAFYKRGNDFLIQVMDADYNFWKEIETNLEEDTYVLLEFQILRIDEKPTESLYNWRYIAYINRDEAQHFQITTEALRAGL